MKLFNSIQINSLARIKTLYRNFKQLYLNITERVQMVTNYGYKKDIKNKKLVILSYLSLSSAALEASSSFSVALCNLVSVDSKSSSNSLILRVRACTSPSA